MLMFMLSLCQDLSVFIRHCMHECTEDMCVLPLFVFLVAPRTDTLVVGSAGFVNQGSKPAFLRVCKRGEGGQHGLKLLLLRPKNHLPGCGWESAKGGSSPSLNAIFFLHLFYCLRCKILFRVTDFGNVFPVFSIWLESDAFSCNTGIFLFFRVIYILNILNGIGHKWKHIQI